MKYSFQSGKMVTPVILQNGIQRKTLVSGNKTMLVEILLPKGSRVEQHVHLHEQIGYVKQGKACMIADGKEQVLSQGDGYVFAGEVAHGCIAYEDTVLVEVFAPVREEYL